MFPGLEDWSNLWGGGDATNPVVDPYFSGGDIYGSGNTPTGTAYNPYTDQSTYDPFAGNSWYDDSAWTNPEADPWDEYFSEYGY
jgi:hypothetical protein